MMVPSAVLSGTPPGKVISPPLETLDLVQRPAGLAELADFAGGHVEEAGRAGLLDRDVDAAQPGAVHADERLEVAAGVDHRDVHRQLQLLRAGDRRRHYHVRLVQTQVLDRQRRRFNGHMPGSH